MTESELQNTNSKKISILAIGDCNTAGAKDVVGEYSVPGQLAKKLEIAGHHCEVTNLGYTMSTSREGLSRSIQDAVPCDILLVNFGLVDAWVTSLPNIYISYYPDSKIKKIFRKLLKSLKKRLRGKTIRKFIPTGQVVPLNEFTKNIQEIILNTKKHSPSSKFILWATVPVDQDAKRNELLMPYDKALSSVANQHGGFYLDTVAILKDKPTDTFYQDTVHLSMQGANLISDELFKLITNNKILE